MDSNPASGASGAGISETDTDPGEAQGELHGELCEVLEHLPHATYLIHPDGQCQYANLAARRFMGLGERVADLSGVDLSRHWRALLHPDEAEAVIANAFENLRRGEPFETYKRMRRAEDGEYRWMHSQMTPIKDASQKIKRWIGTHTDIHEQRVTIERAQEALARAEHERSRWHALFKEFPANLAITRGPHHVFEFVNDEFRQSMSCGDIVGKSLIELDPSFEAQGIIDITDQIYRSGVTLKNAEQPAEVTQADGKKELRFYRGSMIPLKNDKGDVEGLLNVQFDVSDHVRARLEVERTQERLGIALEAGRLGLWEWEAKTAHVWRSETFDRVFGYDSPPAIWNLEELLKHVHPEDRQRVAELYGDNRRLGSRFENEYRVIWPDGSVHWVLDQGKVERDSLGQATRIAGSSVDITSLKEAEFELMKAKEAAESASAAKSRFLANMSHEIRTPLTAIMGFADLLAKPGRDSESRASFAEGIERNGKALVTLIDDLLDIAKIEAGRISILKSPFELGAVLDDVEEFTRIAAEAKGIRLVVRRQNVAGAVIETDRSRLRQILLNVVGNAVKFTEEGEVSVEPRLERIAGAAKARLSICVRDSGIGISPEEAISLFEPFSQADNSLTRRYGGAGLGLAISRQLAGVLGGELRLLESAPGKGSVFLFTLDVDLLPGPRMKSGSESARASDGSARLSKMRILVADDVIDMQNLVSSYLKREKAEVVTVGNGRDAIEVVFQTVDTANEFDLILMDLQMPVMDGYSATIALRQMGFTAPIIGLTAHALQSERERGLRAGLSDYLTKPICSQQLVSAILKARLRKAAPETGALEI